MIVRYFILLLCTHLTHAEVEQFDIENWDPRFNKPDDAVIEVIEKKYSNNYINFNKVLDFMHMSPDKRFHANVIIGLFKIMNKVKHLNDLGHTLKLFPHIDGLLKHQSLLYRSQSMQLQDMRKVLYHNTITVKAHFILHAKVKYADCLTSSVYVDDILERLALYDKAVEEAVITKMTKIARRQLGAEKALDIVEKFSPYFHQNVIAVLVLCKAKKMPKELLPRCDEILSEMQVHPDFEENVPKSIKDRIGMKPPGAKPFDLKGATICFSQKLANGTELYLQQCGFDFHMFCMRNTQRKLQVLRDHLPAYEFKVHNSNYGEKYYIFSSEMKNTIGPGMYTNLFLLEEIDNDGQWLLEASKEGGVAIFNRNKTMYICAGNEKAITQGYRLAYTRDIKGFLKYTKECSWTVGCQS